MSQYYAYRIFLNQDPYKLSFKNKEESFYDVFKDLKKNKSAKFKDWGAEHTIYNYKSFNDEIIVWEFSRKQEFDKEVLGENKIEEIKDEKFPYIFVLFHLKKQIVLIEKNTSVFQKLETVKSKLERYFTDNMILNNVTANLTEISDQRGFWSKLEELDLIESVKLEYEPPNLFGGSKKADEIVREAYEETNFRKLVIFVQNKLNGLKFEYSDFKDHIQRISQGAGSYVVHGVKDGIETTLKSFKEAVKKDISNIDEESKESLKQKFEDIENMNKDEESI